MRPRLAIVCTHPIQYYSPWFRFLAMEGSLEPRVFYLFEPAESGFHDPFFGREVRWDVPLLEGYGHEFVPNVSRHPGPGHFWGFRNPELRRRVASFRPDAVLLIGYNFWSLAAFIATWGRDRAPLIFRGDSHRLAAAPSLRSAIKERIITAIFRRFTAFLYVGAANRRYFECHGVAPGHLFRAPHAVDNARFLAAADAAREEAAQWRGELGIAPGNFVFLFAGKFEAKKRPFDLLEAFAKIGRKDATLLFVGDGPLEAELRRRAGAVANVVVQPFQNQMAMPRTYAACDILVLPSYGAFETWGLAVNEAMCLGKPAIASTHVGCAEDLVISDETGLVFEAGNVSALEQAMRKALEDRARTSTWGRAAREKIAGYSYEAAARGLVEAVNSTVKRRN